MASLASILEHIYSAQDSLNKAGEEINGLSLEPKQKYLLKLSIAFASISAVEKSIYSIDPSLDRDDNYESPDPDLTEEQLILVAKLTDSEVKEIDQHIMELALDRWRKVAMIVGTVMMEMPERVKGIPDVFYSQRVKHLVKQGLLEADGNLDYMRYSEVRLSKVSN